MAVVVDVVDADSFFNQDLAQVEAALSDCIVERVAAQTIALKTINAASLKSVVDALKNMELTA